MVLLCSSHGANLSFRIQTLVKEHVQLRHCPGQLQLWLRRCRQALSHQKESTPQCCKTQQIHTFGPTRGGSPKVQSKKLEANSSVNGTNSSKCWKKVMSRLLNHCLETKKIFTSTCRTSISRRLPRQLSIARRQLLSCKLLSRLAPKNPFEYS